jgi:O-antigen/teichoic acid export membrane protein
MTPKAAVRLTLFRVHRRNARQMNAFAKVRRDSVLFKSQMSHIKKILQGSSSNMLRMLISTLVSLILPPFLVHHLSPAAYSAWVLILQLSAYVNFLDFGLQTAIGKFVAEHHAAGDRDANRRLVSTTFTILTIAASIGAVVTGAMVWQAPRLFHQMPGSLVREVRLGLLALGLSTAFALPFNTFISTFIGLQEYGFPTVIAIISRVATAAGLIILLFANCSLVQLALVMAGCNVATAVSQYLGWRKYASESVPFSFLSFDRNSAHRLVKYGSVLTVWTLSTLFISGLDTIIVGHYDYKNTGFYAIASSATNFMLMVIANLFSPLLPAVSSIQSSATASRMGELSVKATRYCALLLCLLGLPLIFGAYPLLSLWVGHEYAARSALFLEVLVAGNIIRQLILPYTIFVIATGKQHLAALSGMMEAIVNLCLSIWLVQRIGAIGVAIGTLAGAFVGVGVHLTLSMHYTRPTILIRRTRFVLHGLLRPLLSLAPSLLLYPFWRRSAVLPANPLLLIIWAFATAAIIWRTGLSEDERREFRSAPTKLLYWRSERAQRFSE